MKEKLVKLDKTRLESIKEKLLVTQKNKLLNESKTTNITEKVEEEANKLRLNREKTKRIDSN